MGTADSIDGRNCRRCKGKGTFEAIKVTSGRYWVLDKKEPYDVSEPEVFGRCGKCKRTVSWISGKWTDVVEMTGGEPRDRRPWCTACDCETDEYLFDPGEYDVVDEKGIVAGERYSVARKHEEAGTRCGKCGRMAMWVEYTDGRPPEWQWVNRVERAVGKREAKADKAPETAPPADGAAKEGPAEDRDAKKRAEADEKAARRREEEEAKRVAAEAKAARKREAEEAKAAAKAAAPPKPPRDGPPLVVHVLSAPWRAFCHQCSRIELRKDIPKRTYNTLAITMFATFIGTWCLLTYGNFVNRSFIPTPTKVIDAGRFLFAEGDFLTDVLWSAGRIYGGFAVAACLAIPLGIFMGSFKRIEALIAPFCSFVRYMPPTAFVPLIILWFGVGELEKWVVIFIGVFFYLLVLIVDAVGNVEIPLIETAYTLGASKIQVLRKVILPAAWPGIMDALKAMIGAGWTYLIVAELVAAERGIGHMINSMARTMNTAAVMAGIITVGFIGVLTNALLEGAYSLLFPWKRKVAAAD